MEKAAVAENSARLASSTCTLRTFGIGSIIIAEPVTFDTPFTDEPTITSGCSLIKAANPVFQLPLTNVGVRQWVKTRSLFTAALLYVSVFTDELPDGLRPLKPYEYKTQQQALDSARALDLPSAYVKEILDCGSGVLSPAEKGILSDAWDEQSPTWLKDITVVHSITFAGVAVKDVPTDGVDDDPTLTPRTTPLGSEGVA
jgi:hypothetical protein